jgi:hypothetical protein
MLGLHAKHVFTDNARPNSVAGGKERGASCMAPYVPSWNTSSDVRSVQDEYTLPPNTGSSS